MCKRGSWRKAKTNSTVMSLLKTIWWYLGYSPPYAVRPQPNSSVSFYLLSQLCFNYSALQETCHTFFLVKALVCGCHPIIVVPQLFPCPVPSLTPPFQLPSFLSPSGALTFLWPKMVFSDLNCDMFIFLQYDLGIHTSVLFTAVFSALN